jgi:acyl-CoA thioesterase FadM
MTTTDVAARLFVHEIRVSWGDCDPAKIAYTARIPAFALDAINAWWEHYLDGDGWYQLNLDRNVGTPFVHMSLDFRATITPRHRLMCEVWPSRLGTSSIEFRVNGYQNDVLCFEGKFVNVFIIADAFKSQPAPPDLRKIIEPLIRP